MNLTLNDAFKDMGKPMAILRMECKSSLCNLGKHIIFYNGAIDIRKW